MDIRREWQRSIDIAKARHVDVTNAFMQAAEQNGIEHTAEWQLAEVTRARVHLTWWLRIEKCRGASDTPDIEALEAVIEAAHDEILSATTYASTNPIASAIKAYERDALSRWYGDALLILRAHRREAATDETTGAKQTA